MEFWNFLVALATFAFFAGMCWTILGSGVPHWVVVVTGVSAGVIAVNALLGLVS